MTWLLKNQLLQVRGLYLDRKYKQCISFCNQLQSSKLHTAHQVFLIFHQAICYESLGLAAHKYSTKKIESLEQSKEQYGFALEMISSSLTKPEFDGHYSAELSPLADSFASEITSQYGDDVSDQDFAASVTSDDGNSCITSSSSYHSVADEADKTPKASKQNRCQPKREVCNAENEYPNSVITTSYMQKPYQSNHKKRLSQSLSLGHVLDDDLVPSPLFKKSEKQPQSWGDVPDRVCKLSQNLSINGNFRSGSECLEKPLPYAYMHKTSVQLLISRYEGTSGLDFITNNLDFAQIKSTATYLQTSSQHTPSLNIPSSSKYSKCLESFQESIRSHLRSIQNRLDEASKEQVERTAKQQLSKANHRLASYWSFQILDINHDKEEEDSRFKSRRERIKTLREGGWQIRKEKYGWKGEDYYKNLRDAIEAELG